MNCEHASNEPDDQGGRQYETLGRTVVATALLDRLLHHAVVVQIEGASYRLRRHAELIPENARARPISPPPPRRRGRPPKVRQTESTITP